jgi:putative hydrolase of the HAD superfamily
MKSNDPIEAILFDMNGTLRQRIPNEEHQRKAMQELFVLLGIPDAPPSYLDELKSRYKAYIAWANKNETSLPESEIWSRWLTPELPRERVESHAVEWMLKFRNQKGFHELKPNALETIIELSRRGYRLGVISNTTSTVDLPRFVAECGLSEYFEVMVLSSICGIRKPNPGIFQEATRQLNLEPEACAYLGNKPGFDIAGAHRAGFGLAMIILPEKDNLDDAAPALEKPDHILHDLGDLLAIFPPRRKMGEKKA